MPIHGDNAVDRFYGTTILALRHKGDMVIAGDGQVTLDTTMIKHKAKKVRRIYNDKIVVGVSGATADALNLSERLEGKLEQYNGNLTRAAVELARDWRTDKYLRRLEALMVAVDKENIYLISGNGDVIEPDEEVVSIGSGSMGARAAATALLSHSPLTGEEIARAAMQITADLCIYTNTEITIEKL